MNQPNATAPFLPLAHSASSQLSYAQLKIDDQGTPRSTQHNDIYFSKGQGIAESRYVFLQHNALPQRWQTATKEAKPEEKTWLIAETGFGTGLNFYVCAAEFLQQAPAHHQLHFVSFEKYPLHPKDFKAVAAQWPEFEPIHSPTLRLYPELIPGLHRLFIHPRITLDLVFGDVLETLPDWANVHLNQVDAWFLDGFAPSKNPSMWQTKLYFNIAHSLTSNGTLATFTATGHVRRGLEAAGLSMKKAPGFGQKRELLQGVKRTLAAPRKRLPQSIAVLGAGIAAACMATELRDFPGSLHLVWAKDTPADGASGNPQGVLYPLLQAQWSPLSELQAHSFLFARRFYQQHTPDLFHCSGVELRGRSADDQARYQKIIQQGLYPESLLQAKNGHAFLPQAGWLQPQLVVQQLFQQLLDYRQQQGLSTVLLTNEPVQRIEQQTQWQVQTRSHVFTVDQLVLCLAHETALLQAIDANIALPLQTRRGQITLLPAQQLSQLEQVICGQGYVLPPLQGVLCTGASFDAQTSTAVIKASDDNDNIAQLNQMLGTEFTLAQVLAQRASLRATTNDHLPIQGPVARWTKTERNWLFMPRLAILTGLGSRGLTTAPWLAHAIACDILGQALPYGQRLAEATGSQRFYLRAQAAQANTRKG